MLQASQKSIALGEELGFTTREIAELKQVGTLESVVTNTLEETLRNPVTSESIKLFHEAEVFLKARAKTFLSETEARELIHQVGIPTFPRPATIPDNFRIKISNKGAGMKYVHPKDEGTYVRVMPGKPHSKNLCQQKPYVNHRINGQSIDKFGKKVPNDSIESHIPLEEFIYRGF